MSLFFPESFLDFGEASIFQQPCLAISNKDLLISWTLLILNRDRCLQLKVKWGGRMERLRFQTSFSEELVVKRHITIKHELSPDTVIHGKLTP